MKPAGIIKNLIDRFQVQGSQVTTNGYGIAIDQDPEYPTYPIG
jgi:hypothetical protein